MKSRTKKFLWIAGSGLAVVALGAAYWAWRFQHYTPVEAMQDIRAGIAARNDPQPVQKFLELRYGPMTEPANRQRAFVDFFNVGHIEGLNLLVRHMPSSERGPRISAMAQWVADYRASMTPEEKASLKAFFQSPEGGAMLKHARAKYLSQSIRYRAATAQVITELMVTLTEIQKP